MIKIYPAIFHKEKTGYWVEFPDLIGCQSSGYSLEDTMVLAQEALGLYLVSLLEDDKPLPPPSDIDSIRPKQGSTSYVATNIDKYRRDTRAVRRTISIPKWMSDEANKNKISLSKVLQESLKEQLMSRSY